MDGDVRGRSWVTGADRPATSQFGGPSRRAALRYGGATAAVAMATGLRWLLRGSPDVEPSFTVYYPAVALAAIAAGGGPGLLATVLGAVLGLWLFPAGAGGGAALGLFVASGLLVSAAAEAVRRGLRPGPIVPGLVNAGREAGPPQVDSGLRKVASALHWSQERFRLLVENAPAALAMFDREMRFLAVSRRWLADYHLGDPEIIGWSLYDVFPMIPDRWREAHRRGLEGELLRAEEDQIERSDGTILWLRWEIHPWRDAAGAVGGIVLFAEDITVIKRAEEALRRERDLADAIINTAPLIVLLLNPEGRVLRFNPFTERLTGWTLDEARGLPWFETFIPERDRDRIRALFRRALGGERTRANVNAIVTKAGEERDIEWYDVPLKDTSGGLIGLLCTGQDVTERRRAEAALREGEERLRMAVRASRVGLWDWDLRNGRVIYSPEWKAQLGYGDSEISDDVSEWEDRLHPDDLGPALERVRRSIDGPDEGYAVEFRMRHRDGSWRWIYARAEVIRDATGAAIRMLGCHVDVTDRRRAEEALRESRARLRAALQSMSDAVSISNADGHILDLNDAFATFHKFETREGIPRDLADFAGILEVSLADGTPVPPDRWAVRRALRGESATDAEYVLRRKDTGETWVGSYNFAPIRDPEGAIVGSVVVARDITQRKRAEEQLREREARLSAILTAATDAIITIDRRSIIETVNPAAGTLFGYAPEEMVGRDVRMLMPSCLGEERDGHPARWLEAGEGLVIGASREAVARRKDGTLFPVDLAISEVDHLQQFTGIIRDATRRKELERDVVEVASQEQRRIGQDLHDTVGQELTALSILAGDLADALDATPSPAAALAERLARGLRRCQGQLRVVMRGLIPVPVDREGLMAALTDLAERTRQDSKVNCIFDCPEPVAVADNLTATHLYLIAQEAVHNAVKHARPRSIRITLTADDGLVLRVRDDGTGLPSPREEGRGLGLRIMHNRAAIIGARLVVEPASPAGTIVTCELLRNGDE